MAMHEWSILHTRRTHAQKVARKTAWSQLVLFTATRSSSTLIISADKEKGVLACNLFRRTSSPTERFPQ